MADSLKFTIGGQLGPSYRGALAQAEVEALRANNGMQAKMRAQQARIAALDKEYAKASPGSAEASAIAIQQMGKRMALEREFHAMQIKYNLSAAASARRLAAEQIAAQEAVAAATLTNIASGHGAGAASEGGHGGTGGIVREAMVIAREIASGRGGGARTAGSVTILAQRLGFLGKVVKSTAAEQVIASAAASKLSQSMAAEALAAKGTADFARLSAAALKQEQVATESATKAQIALQTAKTAINPLGWVLISGVAIAGIIAGIAMRMHTLAQRAKNLADMLDPLKKKFTEQAEALNENAKEHQEYLDWLKKVGDETDSLPERIEKVIRKMREQAQAEMELARLRGASKMDLEQMDEAQLKAELNVVTLGKLQAQREQEDAKMKADADESALQAFDPASAKTAQRVTDNAGKIMDAVKEKFDTAIEINKRDAAAGGFAFNPNDITSKTKFAGLKIDGNEIPAMSLEEATAAYNKSANESKRLTQIQKQLGDTLANDKMTVEEKTKAVKKLTDEQQGILDELGIKQTTGREIAKLSGTRGRISESEMEKAGLFQSSALIRTHDVLLESLKQQRKIEQNTRHSAQNSTGHRGGVNYGDR